MAQGPPAPSYILRGHSSPIHALHFLLSNSCFVSGDGDGWIVIWSLATKRPLAVWKGHDGGIMSLMDWQNQKLISHGRDHRLRVWQLPIDGFDGMSVALPVDVVDASTSKQPWLLHSLAVNALNYCAFSTCEYDAGAEQSNYRPHDHSILIAAANGLDAGGIDVFQLPSEHRVSKIPSDKEVHTGMVMAVSLFRHPVSQIFVLASGYEAGHVLLYTGSKDSTHELEWTKSMVSQPHTQPVLSLDVTFDCQYVLSSSADAVIAKFNVGTSQLDKRADTKHAGQQDLKVRDDGKIFATAGWDKRIRVYSTKSLKELAVLKWHQEGCYATAFASTTTQALKKSVESDGQDLIKTAVELLRTEQLSKAQNVHWLAAGGKDGKISLWDIY